MIVAAGNNVVGQQLTRITFRNALWSTTQTLTALSGDGTTATATCPGNASYIPGMPVTIAGATPAGFNGTYTVTSMGPTNTITSITSTATTWTVTTLNPHGFVAGNGVYIAGARPPPMTAPLPSAPSSTPTTSPLPILPTPARPRAR